MIIPVRKFLEINNYRDESNDFENLFLSHPNYPSLFAVTDTFDLLGIENVAAQVPKEQFTELPSSYLAVVNDEVVLVRNHQNSITIEKESETKKLSIDDFLMQWNGVVVAIEANEVTVKKKLTLLKNKYFLFAFFLLAILLLQFQTLGWISILNLGILSIGFFIGIVIIDEKLNKTEGVVSKICSFSENTSCDSVIKSESAKLTKWLDFSDLPIVFFGTGILAIVINPNSFSIINFLSLLSLPVVGYSIWLQKIKLEKWCVLCLSISSLLVLQSIFFIFFVENFNFNFLALVQAAMFVLPIWFFVKPVLFDKIKLEKDNLELLKFKRNFSIFSSLQKPVKEQEQLESLQKIELGNKDTNVRLNLILSPSCGHCHTAFKDGIDLISNYPEKLKLAIFFNLNPENADNPYLSVAKNLLQIHKDYPEKIEEALSDWHIEKISLAEWTAKWEQEKIDFQVLETIRSQYEWCLANEFNYTPVKLINSHLFPQEYDLKELKYFISELEEVKEPEMV
ncbi:vitamin K epoxide reductase family protein [Flavobacterium jejuense]|uniref:Vitamin K epoxide reductase family protein n=1 Tax=Flavobacterium jejuense TaxID=1544455 RepID=A0ABX0IY49_9FLAO|nr:vitamin K epoxide reductase family protein [Flavobacterium jejuense]NHN26670.1 vitamin K epoxide reductase family protein [Flavobacterium jejuense]